jgi:hypothetical protein
MKMAACVIRAMTYHPDGGGITDHWNVGKLGPVCATSQPMVSVPREGSTIEDESGLFGRDACRN